MIAAELGGGSRLSLDEALGWIGSRVDDLYGVGVGRLEDIWIDPGTGIPRWLLVKEGRFDGRATLIPFEDAAAGAGRVWIPYEQDVIRRAPQVEPGSPLTQQLEAALRRHYAASAAAAVPHGSAPHAPAVGPGATTYEHRHPGPQPPTFDQQPAAHRAGYEPHRTPPYEPAPSYPSTPERPGHPQLPPEPTHSRARYFAAEPPPTRPAPPVPPRSAPPMRAAPPPPRPPAPVHQFPSPAPAPVPARSGPQQQRPAAAPGEPFSPRGTPYPPAPATPTAPEPGRRPGQPSLAAVEDDRVPSDSDAASAAPGTTASPPGDDREAVAIPVIQALDRPYRIEMQFEGELRISGELKGFRMTPAEEPPG
jgi:hypothetical protein